MGWRSVHGSGRHGPVSRRRRFVALHVAVQVVLLVAAFLLPATAVVAKAPPEPHCQIGLLEQEPPRDSGTACTTSQRTLAASTLADGFEETVVFSGLTNPTSVAFAADGRIFVAEKSGVIKVFDDIADTSPTVFSGLTSNVYDYWDRGMFGLALDPSLTDPDLPLRSRIYVMYTYDHILGDPTAPKWNDSCPDPTTVGCLTSGRITRLDVNGTTISGPETELVADWCQQFPSHSVGALRFGPDGALYASGGDGASFFQTDYGQIGGNPCGDPPDDAMTPPTAEGGALRAQDIRTPSDPTGLNGTIIRIDPVTGAAFPGNPDAASPDLNARRIIAYGMRNPFRFAFRPGSDDMWIGDVGWNDWEEVDRLATVPDTVAHDLGWPCYEGPGPQSGYDGTNLAICENLYTAGPSAVTSPVFSYLHSDTVVTDETCPTGSSAIAGIAVYPSSGGSFPASYQGGLFFADHSRSCIWFMPKGTDGQPDPEQVVNFATGAPNPVDLVVGPNGDLFYVDFEGGAIRRISPIGTNLTPTATIVATPASGPAPLDVDFDGTTSTDPESGALTYAWDLDGDLAYDDSTSPTPSRSYPSDGEVTVGLRVTDPGGKTATDTQVITVGETPHPPVPVISTPVVGTHWGVGDAQPISFSGSATDQEDGTLPASRLSWKLVIQHCPSNCHTHQIETFNGVASGSFFGPDHDYPSYLELTLTATDLDGGSASVTRRLDPRTVNVSFATVPAGFTIGVGSETTAAPFSRTFIDGSRASISAPGPVLHNGSWYAFKSWSDGGAAAHDITARTGGSFTATFAADHAAPVGTAAIAGGAPFTKDLSVTVSVPATDPSGVSHVALSNDGTTWTNRPYAVSQAWTLPAGPDGTRTVFVKWRDQVGHWSAVTTDTIGLDTVAPTATAPRRGLVAGTAIDAGRISVYIPWSGTDDRAGIATYEVAQQTGTGAWATVATATTSAAVLRLLATEQTYRFRVRPTDRAGNTGAWVEGSTFRVSRFSENNSLIKYTGTWTTVTGAPFWGGAARYSTQAGATTALTFTGRSIAWVARTGPDRGKAEVYVDGVKVATVDLYSPALQDMRVIWTKSWTDSVSRKVSIKVLATPGRPRIYLDAFVTAN